MTQWYAHTKEGEPPEKWQPLEEHLENVANLAKDFASVFDCECVAYFAGVLHDLGKFTFSFQNYLERSMKGENVKRGEVVHALQGAKYAEKNISDHIISDIIGNVIATHHNGLFDNITDGERTLALRTDLSEEKLQYDEATSRFSPSIDENMLRSEILDFCKKCQFNNMNPHFMLHLLTKTVYSCVVDADRSDSAGLDVSDKIPDWTRLIQLLNNQLASFPSKKSIDKVRKSISEQCQSAGNRPQGTYTLSVPTGGGKTLSSLRFALEHAQKHNLKRIIYIIPFLSILDQTSAKLHEVLQDNNDDLIFEHHSNIEIPEDDNDEGQYHLLSSRWECPIILTTMVQFLETIYSNKASKLRKFHNMSESVLIFDEIQALPIKCIHLFNEAINFLRTFGKSTTLLCTATQPHLHNTERKILLEDESNIVNITHEDLKIFERVKIEDKTQYAMTNMQISELVKDQIENGKSTLIILNTKGDARKVYEQCKSIECEKTFLTTDLCPAHRLNILNQLRRNLDPKSRRLTLCVSTQLIEAGVDVSFECVIRAEAGFDSIIQAAGRCNRNNEHPTPQTVFIVDVQDEKLTHLASIKQGKDQTKRVLREKRGKNLLSDEVISLFYNYYFHNQKNIMDYWAMGDKTTIYSLLNDNLLGTGAFKSRKNYDYPGLPCAFRTAAEAFSVIEGAQTGIVVPYGDALKLVSDFQRCYNPKEKMRILKKLQKYTVSVYSNVLIKLDSIGGILENIDDTFFLLSLDYYDAEGQGLKSEAMFYFLYA